MKKEARIPGTACKEQPYLRAFPRHKAQLNSCRTVLTQGSLEARPSEAATSSKGGRGPPLPPNSQMTLRPRARVHSLRRNRIVHKRDAFKSQRLLPQTSASFFKIK